MSTAPNTPSTSTTPAFGQRPHPRREFPLTAIIVAGGVILALFATVLFFSRGKPAPATGTAQPLDPYAANLPLSDLAMSESTSLSGGKSTFVDGHVRNTGTETVTAAIVQVFFRNDEGVPPAIETVPLTLIRTREPYVDTQMLSATPLKPGDDREFRLIFETLPPNWNTAMPELRLVHVATR